MKSLKKVFCFIVTICLLLSLLSVPAFAFSYQTARGSALTPLFQCDLNNTTWFYLSNITDDSVDVTITFYNYDGTLITDDGSSSTGLLQNYTTSGGVAVQNYSDSNSDSSITFTFDAHETCCFSIGDSTTEKRGYAVIQWTQDNSSALNALIGFSIIARSGSVYDRTVTQINSGMPF